MAPGVGLAALTFGDLLDAGRALMSGVAWKAFNPSSRHLFSIKGLAVLSADIAVGVAMCLGQSGFTKPSSSNELETRARGSCFSNQCFGRIL